MNKPICYVIDGLELKKDKINVEVINSRFLKPFDNFGILKSIKKTKFVITIEDGTCIGGLGSTVKELLVDNNIKDVRLKSYSYPDKFIEHGHYDIIMKRLELDTESIYNKIKERLDK